MHRAVDTDLIRGFVNVEQFLIWEALTDFRLLIVDQGPAEPWLRNNMKKADFAGVLRGEALARAYAKMD